MAMTLGYMIAAQVQFRDLGRARYFPSGFFHGLACFAYPPMAAVVAFFFCLQILVWKKFRAGWYFYASGVAVWAALFLTIVLRYGIGNYLAVFDFLNNWKTSHYQGSMQSSRVLYVLNEYAHSINIEQTALVVVLLVLSIALTSYRRFMSPRLQTTLYTVLLLSIATYPLSILVPSSEFFRTFRLSLTALSGRDAVFFSSRYLYLIALAGPVFLFLIRGNPLSKIWLFSVWLPSFAGGFAASYFSNIRFNNIGVGVFAAGVATALAAVLYMRESREIPEKWRAIPPSVFSGTIILVLLMALLQVSREDRGIRALGEKIVSGPFKGIYTYSEKKSLLEKLSNDVHGTIARTDKTIVYAYVCPGFYLMTSLKPGVRSIWLSQDDPESVTTEYFAGAGFPDMLVIVGDFLGQKNRPLDAIARLATDKSAYQEIIHRDWAYTRLLPYYIYRKIAYKSASEKTAPSCGGVTLKI